ncbi:uncharacterized protein LOC141902722 isoform X2 [Tubulanus polymorphus]|uniref:uncharacterized protein LOC141902722 isoform X2 n=1 Tax=Tubulanus polymorphus TaxID=672921 RepID=UPI003DA632F0
MRRLIDLILTFGISLTKVLMNTGSLIYLATLVTIIGRQIPSSVDRTLLRLCPSSDGDSHAGRFFEVGSALTFTESFSRTNSTKCSLGDIRLLDFSRTTGDEVDGSGSRPAGGDRKTDIFKRRLKRSNR